MGKNKKEEKIDIEEVECFDKFTYIPKELLEIDDLIYTRDEDGELIDKSN